MQLNADIWEQFSSDESIIIIFKLFSPSHPYANLELDYFIIDNASIQIKLVLFVRSEIIIWFENDNGGWKH